MKYTFTIASLLVTQMVFGQEKQVPSIENSTFGVYSSKRVAVEIDDIFNQAYPAKSPGATVLIAQNDTIVYRKAFGLANVELQVPMKPENVLQLASITKQFTSVAILMLFEQGKLSLHDPLSKYISDFTEGEKITLHNLLNHTSGIKDYTRMPEFRTKTRLDLTPEEIISSFKNLPLEFKPNEKFEYCNSGYVLLGYIIEKISGMRYEDFIQKNIFEQLGMKNSYYGDSYKIITNRASGYQIYEGNLENAEYISTTIPYAAGSLMSTVEDMFLWIKSIHHNTLISEKSKQMAFKNYTLSNGKPDNYGYGWFINELAGMTTLEHSGGINGFSTSGVYIPDLNIYAIVLSNLDDGRGPEMHNLKAVSVLLGKPIVQKESVRLSEKQLKKWEGAYQFEDVVRFITYEDNWLYSMREGGRRLKLIPVSEDEFRFEDLTTTYSFSLKNGKKEVLYTDRIKKSVGFETDKKPASERGSIALPQEILIKYVGIYELRPSFQIEIERQNNRIFAKAPGQAPVELFAESENSFFIKEMDAQIIFNLDLYGVVKTLTYSQGGNKMEGNKIR